MSATVIVMGLRKQWSDEHLFVPTDLHTRCDRCGQRPTHPNHCTREQDRAAVMHWRDRYRELHGE